MPCEEQTEFESKRLWKNVSEAIANEDQHAATEEKTILEEAQRAKARELKATGLEHQPRFFEHDGNSYVYKHSDYRPWDTINDLYQYEKDHVICTKTKHKTPMIRTQSIVSVSEAASEAATKAAAKAAGRSGHRSTATRQTSDESNDGKLRSPMRNANLRTNPMTNNIAVANQGCNFEAALQPLQDQQHQLNERMAKMQHTLDVMSYQQKERDTNSNINRDMVMLVVLVVMIQAMLNWVLSKRAQDAVSGFNPTSPDPNTN